MVRNHWFFAESDDDTTSDSDDDNNENNKNKNNNENNKNKNNNEDTSTTTVTTADDDDDDDDDDDPTNGVPLLNDDANVEAYICAIESCGNVNQFNDIRDAEQFLGGLLDRQVRFTDVLTQERLASSWARIPETIKRQLDDRRDPIHGDDVCPGLDQYHKSIDGERAREMWRDHGV